MSATPIPLAAALMLIAAAPLRAGPDPVDDALVDAFLWTAAGDTPVYRKDIRPWVPPAATPPGRLTGFSRMIGPFTYLPKSAADLTPSERAAMAADPRFAPFARARGSARRDPPALDLAAADMLRSTDIVVVLLPGPR
jgi:hypothetical protein